LPGDISLLGFVAAALLVLLIPGPGVLYVVARSLGQGYRAGLVSVLGLSVGALVHVAAATIGLSAILLTSATAFGIVKLLGAGYLIYLGVRMLLARHPTGSLDTPVPEMMYRLFADGVVVSVLNPKIAVFFIAFLPQFVAPGRGSIPHQFLSLGLLYVALALITDGTYALLAGNIRRLVSGKVMLGPFPQYASGIIFIGLGIGLALTDRRQ
jgi:threonine/homoserine/homoserine lactone efflux protein